MAYVHARLRWPPRIIEAGQMRVRETNRGTDVKLSAQWIGRVRSNTPDLIRFFLKGVILKMPPGIFKNSHGKIDNRKTKSGKRIHGFYKNRYYGTYRKMMSRCYDPKSLDYKRYGARGITVCPEWKNSLKSFIDWCYKNKLKNIHNQTLDRFPDNNGPYKPSNCRFATRLQQSRNRRSNIWVRYNGEKLIFKDFLLKYGKVCPSTVKKRMEQGWDRITASITKTKVI